MRVPRALEFPAVIVATTVLTFTGVSALQACVNPPLAQMAEQRVTAGIQAIVEIEEESEVDEADAMRDIFMRDAAIPASITPREPSAQDAEILASTGADAVIAPAPDGQAVGAPAQPEGPAAPGMEQAAVVPPPVTAQASVPAGPGLSHVPAVAAPQAQQHAAAPATSAKPAPVSGMDYVWDQVFGSGSYAKPAAPARPATPPAGSNSQGANHAATCPPGQAKKDKC
jgi:hypothetical protein